MLRPRLLHKEQDGAGVGTSSASRESVLYAEWALAETSCFKLYNCICKST